MASASTFRRGATLWLSALLLLSLDCKRTMQSYPDAVAGVGVVVQTTGSGHAISRVVTGGPAATAGLQVGDRILAVNGEPTDGKPLASIVDALRGEAGSNVIVRVRGNHGDMTVTLTRQQLAKKGSDYQVE